MTLAGYMRRNVVAAVVCLVFIAPVFWMIFLDRDQPYVHDYGTITPTDPKPGDQLTVQWIMKKVNRVCDGWVQREIIDSQGVICVYERQPAIRRDQLSAQQKGGTPDRLMRSFPLCDRAAPGPAKYRAYTCYECNPLQKWFPVCVRTPDINFNIRPQ
jgi:hypothetical protein